MTLHTFQRFQHFTLALTCILAMAIFAAPAAADDSEGWRLRLAGVFVDPDLDTSGFDNEGNAVRVEAESTLGLALRAEYRFSRRLGFELGILRADADLGIHILRPGFDRIQLGASPSMTPITAGLLVHLTPDRSFDLYLAGRFAYVFYGDTALQAPELGRQEFTADDELGWSLALGADIPLGDEGWGLHFEVAHLDTRLTLTNVDDGFESDFELDPTLISAGVVYRF